MKRHFTSLGLALAAALTMAVSGPVLAGQRAVPRERTDNNGPQDSGSSRAVPRGSGGSGGGTSTAAPRSGGGTSTARPATRSDGGSQGGGSAVPPYSRPREGRNPTGTAVTRSADNPRPGGGTTVIVPGYGYPWGWGYAGLGFGGYYGYYDPWWYDEYYSPYYARPYFSSAFEGSLRLKMKPREAAVFVDGYFAGKVDEFDGMFQRLRVEPGPHRIEVRADGYEPLTFEVRILPDRTVTYEGELKPLQ